MSNNLLISIVVPIYNVKEYLDDCIKSIVNQIYKNLEIILVDDGSTDGGGELCEEWAKKDKRIRVIHKEHTGPSGARNAGIKLAKGQLFGFVDSDDIIHPEMYRSLYELMEKTGAKITCCGFRRDCTFDGFIENKEFNHTEYAEYTVNDALLALMKETDIHAVVWNKLYTREMIEGIEFREFCYHEDEFWLPPVIARAKRVVTTKNVYYGYRQRANSIMNQKYSVRHLDLLFAREERVAFFEKYFPDLASEARCRLRFECIRAMQLTRKFVSREEQEDFKKIIRKKVKDNVLLKQDYQHLPFGRRVWCFLSNISFDGTCIIRNVFHYGP